MMELNDIEFDHVFTVDEHGTVTHPDNIYAPEVTWDGLTSGQIWSYKWEFIDGWSGQDRYSGPVMHSSELLGGGMERWVLATPGTYVMCVVEDLDDPEDPAGWCLLTRSKNDT